MFSAREARNSGKETLLLQIIEDRIKKASARNEMFIYVTIGDWNESEFDKVEKTLKENGYKVEMSGLAGYHSYYYKISWY